MSLAETQQIFSLLTQIDELLKGIQVEVQRLEGGSGGQASVYTLTYMYSRLARVATQYLAVSRRMGLPDDIKAQIDTFAKLIVIGNSARMTISMLGAGGLLGVLGGGAAAIMTGMMATDFIMSMGE